MTNHFHPILTKYFNILGVFNLNFYMRSMGALYNNLREIKKKSFSPQDRIIFTLFDHDYCFDYKLPGWTLYNLQLILHDLDISNFFCLLLTHQPDYDEFTSYVQRQLTDDDFPIRSITTFLGHRDWFPEKPLVSKESPSIGQIEKSYCVLSRQARNHRTFFMAKLMENDLLDHGLIAYNNVKDPILESKNNFSLSKSKSPFSFLEIPVNLPYLILRQDSNKEVFKLFNCKYKSYKNFTEDIDIINKAACNSLSNRPPIKKSFLYVALETMPQMPRVHTSMISLRGILNCRPFVLFSSPGALKFLRSRGFKTFNDFWDESYDDTSDLEQRVEKIINIIKNFSRLSKIQLIGIYQDMKTIIDHNHDFYHNEFAISESKIFDKECKQNLNVNNLIAD